MDGAVEGAVDGARDGEGRGRGGEGEGRGGRQSPVQRSYDRIGHRIESGRESNAEHVFISNF